jgi:hypothetical protein
MENTIVGAGAALRYGFGSCQMMRLRNTDIETLKYTFMYRYWPRLWAGRIFCLEAWVNFNIEIKILKFFKPPVG